MHTSTFFLVGVFVFILQKKESLEDAPSFEKVLF